MLLRGWKSSIANPVIWLKYTENGSSSEYCLPTWSRYLYILSMADTLLKDKASIPEILSKQAVEAIHDCAELLEKISKSGRLDVLERFGFIETQDYVPQIQKLCRHQAEAPLYPQLEIRQKSPFALQRCVLDLRAKLQAVMNLELESVRKTSSRQPRRKIGFYTSVKRSNYYR